MIKKFNWFRQQVFIYTYTHTYTHNPAICGKWCHSSWWLSNLFTKISHICFEKIHARTVLNANVHDAACSVWKSTVRMLRKIRNRMEGKRWFHLLHNKVLQNDCKITIIMWKYETMTGYLIIYVGVNFIKGKWIAVLAVISSCEFGFHVVILFEEIWWKYFEILEPF